MCFNIFNGSGDIHTRDIVESFMSACGFRISPAGCLRVCIMFCIRDDGDATLVDLYERETGIIAKIVNCKIITVKISDVHEDVWKSVQTLKTARFFN